LSKPTASSLSKSRSTHTLTPTTSPPKSKPTPTKTGTLNTGRKSTTISNLGSKTKSANSTSAKASVKEDGDAREESHENGNGLKMGMPTDEEVSLPEVEPLDGEHHEPEPDCQHEHFENGSLEVSYIEEPSETVDESRTFDLGEVARQHYVEDLEAFVHSHSPEPGDLTSYLPVQGAATSEPAHDSNTDTNGGPNQGSPDDDIADMVGLLESTSFSSKHIFQGSDDSVASDSHVSVLEKEPHKIGEIPDE